MAQTNRLADGGRIDRNKPLQFTFNGRRYQGYAGDTLASALLANGVDIVGRSFKYHRPRGIFAAGAEEPNALIQIGKGASTEPNQRATQVELYEGMVARTVKGWPGLKFDIAVVNDWLSKMFSAGFYYKTFMRPAKLWHLYEKIIRSSAGLGKAPLKNDPDSYSHQNIHCDVLIAGGGPTGLMAALAAGRAGARVILADEQNEYGGSLLSSTAVIDGKPAFDCVRECVEELATMDNVTLLNRSTVFGYFDQNFLAIAQRCTQHLGESTPGSVRQRMWRVRAKRVVLAQGAFERPLVFGNNDCPGVMLASAVSTYINRYAVCPGKRAVVFANNDHAYQSALDLHRNGCVVVAVIDNRANGAADIANKVRAAGIAVKTSSVVSNVRGRSRVKAVEVVSLNDATGAVIGSRPEVFDCDLLAVSGGWSPAVHLYSQSGGRNVWDDELLCFVPGTPTQNNISAGSGKGTWDLDTCFREGVAAGRDTVTSLGFETTTVQIPATQSLNSNPLEALWRVPAVDDPEYGPKQFVDFQNDTTVTDIRLAIREGFDNVEHVKRYTAMGFGTDQGKLGNINGMAIVAETLNKPIPEVGTTTFRPAYTPVSFGVCAGEDIGNLYEPVRKTALHAWHEQQLAPFEVVGQWHRPWYFPKDNEDLDASVARECLATRSSVGIMDASTLGKIDVRGPDAVTFLERIYTHDIAKMKVGRCAYGIMMSEDGMVMDDGVMTRLAEDRFYLTTTTGGAAAVMSWLELWLQTEWPDLDVYLTSVTDHFSTIALVGPQSRSVLEILDCDIDVEREAFPFMSFREGHIGGIPIQLFRVSFSGELAFEINVDSNYVAQIWDQVWAAGQEFGITPYGTESLHVLRAEKGFIIVGQETDGSVTPVDLRMNWLLSKNKDYLGKRSLARSDSARKNRKQLVGLLSVDGQSKISEGSQVLGPDHDSDTSSSCGHVSSSYHSAVLGHPIALALIESGHARKDEIVITVSSDGVEIPAKIVSPVFYDPKGERQHV